MKTIFFGASSSIVKWAYKDIYENSDIEYCEYDAKTSLKGLKKLLICTGKGKLLPYGIKDRLYKKTLGYKFLFEKENEVLFVFTCQNGLFYQGGFFTFVNYLKSKYKNCKCVFYYNDLISTCEPTKLDGVKSVFDLVLTFDSVEAQKYGISYYGVVHSKALPSNEESAEESDIFYAGSDRGRYNDIIKAFTIFADSGKRCVFYLFDVLKENKENLNAFLKSCKQN
ncbi:MAG: hypothetical protein SPL13_03490, partial [Clostridia bacterium]|nr:hypothetical protein [Clostridia bacterium]